MSGFRVPMRAALLVLATSFLVGVGFLNVRERLVTVYPSDGVRWAETPGGLVADEVVAGGAAYLAGIRPGDRLVSFGGRPVPHLGAYADLIFEHAPGQGVRYAVAAAGALREVDVKLAARSSFSGIDALRTLLALIHLGIGLFVVLRAARPRRAVHFYWVCLSAFVVYLYSYTASWNVLDQWVYCFSVASFLLLPALLVHFALRFPGEGASTSGRLALLYFPAMGLGLLQAAWLTGRLASWGLPRDAASAGRLDRIQLLYFCAGFAAAAIVLIRRRATVPDWTSQQQMKWISYGTLAGVVPFGALYGIPFLAGVVPGFGLSASMLFLALLPLSFAYAVLKFRLNDVEVIARRSTAYMVASGALLAAYILAVIVAGRGVESIVPGAGPVLMVVAALAVALLFAPLRDRIQRSLDRRFYGEGFEERATLLEFARTLSSGVSLQELAQGVADRVARTFDVSAAAVWVYSEVPERFTLLAATPGAVTSEIEVLDRGELGSAVTEALAGAKEGGRLAESGFCLVQPLCVRGSVVGLIGLAKLRHGRELPTADRELLAALARYAAVGLENARLYRSVEKRAEEMGRLKAYTENILESINIAVLALDASGRVTSCNRTFELLFEAPRDQVRGRRVEELLSADVIASIRSAAGSETWEVTEPAHVFKLAFESRAGRRLIVNLSVIPLAGTFESWSGCLLVMDDISEKVQLEAQMQQVEKLSSLGLLAAGIAHEVNTPIAGISSYAQMLIKQTPDSDARRKLLEKIETQSFRASEIVNGLLNFARLNGSEFQDLDLNQLIRDSVALIEHQMQQVHVRVNTALDGTIPTVYGNAGRLQQVFVNLFLNARDAMPEGGDLEIRTAMNDSMVMVDVHDTGVGISAENIKRIYDPFFTTKSTGKGTGLGLAVTYGILQDHGGRIFVDSVPGSGTTFRIKLPTRERPRR